MLYFKDANNNVHYTTDEKYLPPGGVLITWQEVQELQNPPTLEQVKLEKIQEIESHRDTQCTQDVTALGRQWQADSRSQNLLNAAINLTQAGLPLPPVWRDAQNNNMSVSSINDLLAIAGAIAIQTQTAYSDSWAKKQSVLNAVTVQEVRAIAA